MIYDIQEDRYDLLQGAAGIALYCMNRNERFPREYLNRFIAELYKRMTLGKLNNIRIIASHPACRDFICWFGKYG